MWKQIYEFFSGLVFLLRDTVENKRRMQEIALQVKRLHEEVLNISTELRRLEERERLEREKFMLQVENFLLRDQRQLPAKKRRKR